MAKRGTNGPARRSRLLSPVWWAGPPPIPRMELPRATNTVTRPPRRSRLGKPLADSGSEPRANVSPHLKKPAARVTQHPGDWDWGCTSASDFFAREFRLSRTTGERAAWAFA
jgi:hypothetical protein